MILLYHNIFSDNNPAERLCMGQALPVFSFERHIQWLLKGHTIVSLAEYMSVLQKQDSSKKKSKLIALTFDDGIKTSFQCIFPFLFANSIPATIFVVTGHLEHSGLVWFNFLRGLCFENCHESIEVNRLTFPLQTIPQRKKAWVQLCSWAKASGDPSRFSNVLSKKYPLSPDVIALYEGMTNDQIKIAVKSQIIEIGAHTITHPYLNLQSKEEQADEILGSKAILTELTRKPIRYFAYPGGEYNNESIEIVRAAGFEASFAVIPKNIEMMNHYEMGRVGIYSQSLLKLQLKTMGLVNIARRAGMRIG